jgi:hypothetical protein
MFNKFHHIKFSLLPASSGMNRVRKFDITAGNIFQ